MYHTLGLYARPNDIHRAETVAEGLWRDQGFVINNITFLHRPALMSAMPMSFTKNMQHDLYSLGYLVDQEYQQCRAYVAHGQRMARLEESGAALRWGNAARSRVSIFMTTPKATPTPRLSARRVEVGLPQRNGLDLGARAKV